MKYVDAFRDGTIARRLAATIAGAVDPARTYRYMEFCGGHTHAIARFGLADLLPGNVRLIHGPGCPVCVLPVGRIDQAVNLALEQGVILCSYGDVMRVPASGGLSLLGARARGADVRMVYSPADALGVARANPDRQVVFLAIGFETTTPPTALVIRDAAREGLANFSVLCNHVLTPAAMHQLLDETGESGPSPVPIDGFIGPAHVSVVIGTRAYEHFAQTWHRPVVIAGFEPLDVMQAVSMLVRQTHAGRAQVENQFTRAVRREGNPAARAAIDAVFETADGFEWRGLGWLPHSALRIRADCARFDAERRFGLVDRRVPDHPQCACAAMLRGRMSPPECRLFGTACTPETPLGPCMVSSEGACAAHWTYGRFRGVPVRTEAGSQPVLR
jgi:hydrogenase expression/formation protein HypD